MKKKFFLSLALGMSLFSSVAFAELNGRQVEAEFKGYFGWPITALCTGSDVNLRTDPGTDSNVITMLQKGDEFHITDVVFRSDYTWMKGVTSDGTTGYMVSKYLDYKPGYGTRAGRFRAAFQSATLYDINKFANALGGAPIYPIEKAEPELFHYATHKAKVGKYWAHGEAYPGEFHVIGVDVTEPGYQVASLEVGRFMDKENIATLDQDMKSIGWVDGGNYNGVYHWYWQEKVDGQFRPVEGFCVKVENNTITGIQWYRIPID